MNREPTYALLHLFHIFHAHTDSPCSSEMPGSLQRQVLYHDPSQCDQLGIQRPKNTMIRKIESIRDLPRDEVEVLMSFERVGRRRQISCINRLQPLLPSFKVLRSSLPFLPAAYQSRPCPGSSCIPRERIIPILRPLNLCNREQRLERLANTLYGYILYQHLPQTAYERLSRFRCGEFRLVDQVGVEVGGMFGFDSHEGRKLADVNQR
jgi:hypothetical protein